MRLRKKPWIDEAIKQFGDLVIFNPAESKKGRWREMFGRPDAPLYVELGTGKGRFITQMAAGHPEINFIGIEAQTGVIYYAAQKAAQMELGNIKLVVFDINNLTDIFAPDEIDRIYINFCDPWPKKRHAKRRLTHINFLNKYQEVLKDGGKLIFKTDNTDLFDFSLEQFAEKGLSVENITYDLHAEPLAASNIMTEYEMKFSAKGVKIKSCQVTFGGK